MLLKTGLLKLLLPSTLLVMLNHNYKLSVESILMKVNNYSKILLHLVLNYLLLTLLPTHIPPQLFLLSKLKLKKLLLPRRVKKVLLPKLSLLNKTVLLLLNKLLNSKKYSNTSIKIIPTLSVNWNSRVYYKV